MLGSSETMGRATKDLLTEALELPPHDRAKIAAELLPALAARKAPPAYLTAEFFLEFPARDQVRAELGQLLGRGTQCLFLYTGGLADLYFNHRRQFKEGTRRMRRGDQSMQVPQIRMEVDGTIVTLTVLDRDDERFSRARDEDTPQRARIAEVEALLSSREAASPLPARNR